MYLSKKAKKDIDDPDNKIPKSETHNKKRKTLTNIQSLKTKQSIT